MTYIEKLRDPRWQKKRLEIMSRDEFMCQCCADKETNLQVHHLNYRKGAEPWEYPDTNFVTLCDRCHKFVGDLKLRFGFFLNNCLSIELCSEFLNCADEQHAPSLLIILDALNSDAKLFKKVYKECSKSTVKRISERTHNAATIS